jgi:hypothetical protein
MSCISYNALLGGIVPTKIYLQVFIRTVASGFVMLPANVIFSYGFLQINTLVEHRNKKVKPRTSPSSTSRKVIPQNEAPAERSSRAMEKKKVDSARLVIESYRSLDDANDITSAFEIFAQVEAEMATRKAAASQVVKADVVSRVWKRYKARKLLRSSALNLRRQRLHDIGCLNEDFNTWKCISCPFASNDVKTFKCAACGKSTKVGGHQDSR